MSDRPILRMPDARLRHVAAPVGEVTDEIRALADEMLRVMYAAPGRGLAGPQIGEMRRIFVMDCGWKEGAPDPRVMIDPEIVWASPETVSCSEGCLSLPGMTVEVTRPAAVRLRFTGLDGARHDDAFTGFAAVCVQHERDHLDGILCIDRLDAQTRAAMAEVLRAIEGP